MCVCLRVNNFKLQSDNIHELLENDSSYINNFHSKSSHALDPRRKQEGTTKRDVEKICGARDEGSRVQLGTDCKAGSRQTTMAFLGVGLMCEHARRGLSIK